MLCLPGSMKILQIIFKKVLSNRQDELSFEPRSDKRDLLAIKVKIEIFTEKKDQTVLNNYRKFEEVIFTNNKDMSI